MYHKTTLDNGLRLVTSPMPHTHSVCLAFFIGTGARHETEAEAGIAHFIEHVSFRGTDRRPTSRDITEPIEGVGGIINGGTAKELTTFWCKIASLHLPLAVDIFVDLLCHSRFDAKDIEQERHIITEEIKMSFDSPQYRVDTLIDELLWPGQPLGRDVAGTKETVSTLTRQQMLDFIARHYLPNNTVVSIAGNIDPEQAAASFDQALGHWKPGVMPKGHACDDKQGTPRIGIEFRDTEQVHLCLGLPGLSLSHPDRFAADLLNVVLGEGMSSRLFTHVREQQGLAYDVHSYINHFTDTGSLTIYAGVDPEQTGTAIAAILEELSQLKENVSEAELNKAREMTKGRLLLRMEDSRSVASWLGAQEILTEHILDVDEVISLIDAITLEDLKQTAEHLLVGERLNLAIVGPIREEEPLAALLKL